MRCFRIGMTAVLAGLVLAGCNNEDWWLEKTYPDKKPCPEFDAQKIFDSHIRGIVAGAKSIQKIIDNGECYGHQNRLCHNTEPYFSVAQFKQENPDCCRVLDKIPGEFSNKYRDNIRGIKYPKFYILQITYKKSVLNDGEYSKINKTRGYLYDCFGNDVSTILN